MVFTISMDTYTNQHRNIFGIKNGKVTIEPFLIAFCCENGKNIAFQFKSARIKDDNSWLNSPVKPYEYAIKSDRQIYETAIQWMKLQNIGSMDYVEIIGDEKWVGPASLKRMKTFIKTDGIENLITDFLKHTPDSEFSAGNSDYLITINLEEGQYYKEEQKRDIFYRHKRYPHPTMGELSLDRAIRTMKLYQLMKSIEEKH